MVKMVLVVRNDLGMRKGKVAAQAAHAAQEAIIERDAITGEPRLKDNMLIREWLACDYVKITVRVDSEAELLNLYAQAQKAGLIASLVQDLGHTEFHGQLTYTAIALGPAQAEDLDPLTGHLKLL